MPLGGNVFGTSQAELPEAEDVFDPAKHPVDNNFFPTGSSFPLSAGQRFLARFPLPSNPPSHFHRGASLVTSPVAAPLLQAFLGFLARCHSRLPATESFGKRITAIPRALFLDSIAIDCLGLPHQIRDHFL